MSWPIYMDNHSTTRVDPRVVEEMTPFFTENYGNASSVSHVFGSRAGEAVERSRESIAGALGCGAREIVFTSGATESNNLAIAGAMQAAAPGSHLIVNASEHKAVLDPALGLQAAGFDVTILPVDQHGMVDPDDVASAVQPNTVLVSMLGNNEVGSINLVREISRICRERGVFVHTDATQAFGKVGVDVGRLGVDLLSVSAHKVYGPKGVGALFVRRGTPRVRLKPLVAGGGHERGLRSGTLAVPLIVGLGAACRMAKDVLDTESQRLRELRDRLLESLRSRVDDLRVNGHPDERLPGNAHVSIPGVNAEALLLRLRDVVALSTGSACTTAEPEPSHVLRAMGLSDDLIESSIRFGLGRFNDEGEVDAVVEAICESVDHLRRLAV